MGVAITSGVLASMHPQSLFNGNAPEKWESHTPGTMSPTLDADASLPSRFIACVSREETAKRLVQTFAPIPGSSSIIIWAGRNVEAVKQSDVILLWLEYLYSQSVRF